MWNVNDVKTVHFMLW